jgi:hypothetical protein
MGDSNARTRDVMKHIKAHETQIEAIEAATHYQCIDFLGTHKNPRQFKRGPDVFLVIVQVRGQAHITASGNQSERYMAAPR